jgi:hypothetical protein
VKKTIFLVNRFSITILDKSPYHFNTNLTILNRKLYNITHNIEKILVNQPSRLYNNITSTGELLQPYKELN